jgi:hypothetical protein
MTLLDSSTWEGRIFSGEWISGSGEEVQAVGTHIMQGGRFHKRPRREELESLLALEHQSVHA